MLRAFAVGLGLMTVSGTAWALDEGQWQLGVAPALAAGFDDHGASPGGGGRIDGRYAITDALSACAAGGSLWWSSPQHHTTRVSSASVGVLLAFDVLRTIPFVSLAMAAAHVGSGTGSGAALGGELSAGAEYLLDPKWSVGLVVGGQWFPVRLGAQTREGAVTLGLRLARTF
jgi:hypothetical protein